MVNKMKQKGSQWERDAKDYLNEHLDDAKFERVPGSGAIGTLLHEGLLTADLRGKVSGFSKSFKAECKVGYGGAKQITLKKEWLDKVVSEAQSTYSIPMLLGKFSGARDGVKYFAVLDLDTLIEILNRVTSLNDSK